MSLPALAPLPAHDTCREGSCGRPVKARSLCNHHYTQWYRTAGRQHEPMIECARCGRAFHLTVRYPGDGHCGTCRHELTRAIRRAALRPLGATCCTECGTAFTSPDAYRRTGLCRRCYIRNYMRRYTPPGLRAEQRAP